MTNQNINSREYKVMLKPEKFKGDEEKLLSVSQEFWDLFSIATTDIVTITNDKIEVDKKRHIRFYDTDDHMLYEKHEYVFRERFEGDDREITLKFRHHDRYVSQARDMRDKDGKEDKMKFEQDIKPPAFVNLFSYSNKRKIKPSKNLNKLNDLGRLFPDVQKRLGNDYDDDTAIKVVSDFTAYEIVLERGGFIIDEETQLKCECAIIAWYDSKFTGEPLVAEFSFKYKDESGKEDFGGEAALKAYNVFQRLQANDQLLKWVDLEGPTKTGFAYNNYA